MGRMNSVPSLIAFPIIKPGFGALAILPSLIPGTVSAAVGYVDTE